MVRALAFHQCGPGSISALGVKRGLSLLVLYSAMRGFSPGTLVFPSHQKPTFDLQKNFFSEMLRQKPGRYVKIWIINIHVCTSKKLVNDIIFNALEVFFLTFALWYEVVQCDRD